MRIGVQAQLQVIFALIRSPYLGPTEKEALFWREPVDLSALTVKSVRHFVSDYRAHPAVINGVIGFRIEERRLQNARWENDLVHHWVVIGIHCWRRHSPFASIDRFADFFELAIYFEIRGSHGVRGI